MNRTEELADQLLELLKNPPEPLLRDPVLDPELLDLVAKYSAGTDSVALEDGSAAYPVVRFLELGNGNQARNRERAMRATTALVREIAAVDKNTVRVEGQGDFHFAAFSHPKGAMISSTRMTDANFGGADWHSKERIVMFRDVGDGRCILYFARIEPLFEHRTIGHHGVRWEDVERLSDRSAIIPSQDALEVAPVGM